MPVGHVKAVELPGQLDSVQWREESKQGYFPL